MNHDAYRTARYPLAFGLVAVALGLGSASCTGDDSANHVLSQAEVPDETVLFDDFGTLTAAGAAPQNMVMGFTGNGWYKYDDFSLDPPDGGPADAAPPMGKQVVAVETLPAPHLTLNGVMSTTAMHIYGGSYSGWGSGVGGQFNANAPKDLSAYTGIIFWAKKGTDSASSAMTVSVPSLNDQEVEGGVCHGTETPGKHDRCSDSFHLAITLRPEWTLYVIAFSDLAQQGWGYKPLGGFDRRLATGLAFSNNGVSSKGGAPFDEWIDDVAFFK